MKKLQDFRFNKSHYDRPTQKKVCGWSLYGRPCQSGPDKKGECQGRYECIPTKKGDRWSCARPGESGGKCSQGPHPDGTCRHKIPPCVPIDGIRSRRRKVISWAAAFSLLFLLAFLAGNTFTGFIDPGELTAKHSFKDQQCSNCHGDTGKWLSKAVSSERVEHANQRCASCHRISGSIHNAHNQPPETLQAISAKLTKTEKPVHKFDQTIACAVCHKEHKGREFRLSKMSDARCESCHAIKHPDFAGQHPEFRKYPYPRRTRLRFDHFTHETDYFKNKKLQKHAPSDCKGCHVAGESGMYMRVKEFDKTCRGCHQKAVTAQPRKPEDQSGIAVFSVPEIDIATIRARGHSVGEWPESSDSLSPVMIYLLSRHIELHPLLRKIQNGSVQLADLSGADDYMVQLAAKLAWHLKRILHEAQGSHGMAKLRARISELSQGKGSAKTREFLFHRMPQALVRESVRRWFPNLEREIGRLASRAMPATRRVSVGKESIGHVLPGSWYRKGNGLYYRPSGHNDPLIRSWLNHAQQNQGNAQAGKVFGYFAGKNTAGDCVSCHSVDKTGKGLVINWKPRGHKTDYRSFTRFNHKKHGSITKEKGCKTCHAIDTAIGSKYLDGFEDRNPMTFASNFKPLKKAACASCHTRDKAGQDCLTCHYYHVGTVSPATRKGGTPK